MRSSVKKRVLVVSLVILLILVIAVIWLLKPKSVDATIRSTTQPTTHIQTDLANSNTVIPIAAQQRVPGSMPTLAPSLRGTEIDCPLQVDTKGQLVLTIGIRNCFDYFLSSLGEKTEAQLIADIRQYLTATLPSTALSYALKLLDQYVALRHAQTQPSMQVKTQTPDSLQEIVLQLKSLRLKYFTPIESEVFFGHEEAYDLYSINLMRINADKSLSEDQKAKKIAALMDQMPASLAENMRPLMQFAQLQKLTQAIQGRGGSAEELRTMRESLVGAAAADRLGKLDAENADWQQQLNRYLKARAQIQTSVADEVNRQHAISILRNQTFSSPEDRIRAQTYETMRDSGDNRNF